MALFSDTDAYPAFSGATAKQALLRALLAAKDNPQQIISVIAQINNTDLNAGLTDGATVYGWEGTFAA